MPGLNDFQDDAGFQWRVAKVPGKFLPVAARLTRKPPGVLYIPHAFHPETRQARECAIVMQCLGATTTSFDGLPLCRGRRSLLEATQVVAQLAALAGQWTCIVCGPRPWKSEAF
ncbi:hypothetical protein MRX96_029036 [Rhipicephalus microplus]